MAKTILKRSVRCCSHRCRRCANIFSTRSTLRRTTHAHWDRALPPTPSPAPFDRLQPTPRGSPSQPPAPGRPGRNAEFNLCRRPAEQIPIARLLLQRRAIGGNRRLKPRRPTRSPPSASSALPRLSWVVAQSMIRARQLLERLLKDFPDGAPECSVVTARIALLVERPSLPSRGRFPCSSGCPGGTQEAAWANSSKPADSSVDDTSPG